MLKLIRNVFLLTLPSLVAMFLALELFFRIAIPATDPPNVCFDTSEGVLKFCTDQPSGTSSFGKLARLRTTWRINNDGWNSPIDYSAEKSKPRIAVIGDSFIQALQVDVDKSYPSLLGQALASEYEVYAFGMSGAALSEYLNMCRYANRRFDPDVLIINVVHNDFNESVLALNPTETHMLTLNVEGDDVTENPPRPNYSFVQYNPTKRLLRKSAVIRYVTFNLNVKQTLRRLRAKEKFAANVELDAIRRNDRQIRTAVDYVVRRIKEENPGKRVLFVLDAPRSDIYSNTVEESRVLFMHTMLREICAARGVELLDLTDAMRQDYAERGVPFNSTTDGHWNAYGHEFVTRQVLGKLREGG